MKWLAACLLSMTAARAYYVTSPLVWANSYIVGEKLYTFAIFEDTPPGTEVAFTDWGMALVPHETVPTTFEPAIVIDNFDGHSVLYPRALIFTNYGWSTAPHDDAPEPGTWILALVGLLLIAQKAATATRRHEPPV